MKKEIDCPLAIYLIFLALYFIVGILLGSTIKPIEDYAQPEVNCTVVDGVVWVRIPVIPNEYKTQDCLEYRRVNVLETCMYDNTGKLIAGNATCKRVKA